VVNGVTIASAAGGGDADGAAAALRAAWEASAHPYAEGITATVSTDTVTLTGTAEIPFTATSSASGGSGTIGSVTVTTAATGPHTLDEAENWNGEALPSNDDILYFRDSSIDVAWGLAGLSTSGHTVFIEASYTGNIGLNRAGVATTADGQTVNTGAPEYRALYLQLDIARLEIGGHDGVGNPGGSQRLMIDNDRASGSQTVIHRTSPTNAEQGKPPVRLLMAHASAHVEHRDGQFGIGVDEPGETSTIGNLVSKGGGFYLGDGVTVTNITVHEGSSRANLRAATLTKALVHGGNLVLDGDQAVTTLEVTGGRAESNTTGTITTCTHKGGTVDYSVGGEARIVTTHQLYRGATLKTNDDVVTITNLLEPDGPSTIVVS
jgi:Rieske Fe-S protein